MDTSQWFWMMDYCKKHSIPPAQSWAWEKARQAYNLDKLVNNLKHPLTDPLVETLKEDAVY